MAVNDAIDAVRKLTASYGNYELGKARWMRVSMAASDAMDAVRKLTASYGNYGNCGFPALCCLSAASLNR